MPTLLFVDACIRGEESRTAKLCNAFIEAYVLHHPGFVVQRVNLMELGLAPFSRAMLEERDALIQQGTLDKPLFDLARQFAAADKIVIGAPYWDLSFPAILKIYVEHITVCGITFRYAADWLEGLCRADSIAYVTTSGGPLDGINFGYDYFCGQCGQFGFNSCQLVSAEGLDMVGSDMDAIMGRALQKAREMAKNF